MTKEQKSTESKGKLDLQKRVLTIDQKEIPIENEPLTIKKAIKFAVLNVDGKTRSQSPEDKYEAYKLALKLEEPDPSFTVEELARIKKDVGTMWSPEVVGFIWDVIEGK